jgi:hypothetical protein
MQSVYLQSFTVILGWKGKNFFKIFVFLCFLDTKKIFKKLAK